MLSKDVIGDIYAYGKDIPAAALAHLQPFIIDALGNSFGDVFRRFSQDFPITAGIIDRHYGKPMLALKLHRKRWLAWIVLESPARNIFFHLEPIFVESEGSEFDEYRRMLPVKWKELYRWFDSFLITEKSIFSLTWWNTPFSYSSRLNLLQYMEGSGATKSQIKAFAKQFNCNRYELMCWLLTENEDALFINEKACDRKVYHVKGTAFEDVFELPDPELTLDKYLAHVVSGQSPATFDFRA